MTSDLAAWVSAAAVIITGGATAFLAWRTSNLAGSTDTMAKAGHEAIGLQRQELQAVTNELELVRQQSEATAAMAKTMQLERELAERPYLAVEVLNPPYLDDLMVHNVGRGPALNCVWTCIADPATTWRRSKVFSVAPGSGRRLRDSDITQPGAPIPGPLWDYGQLDERGAHHVAGVHALFCQDETGTRLYRFIDGRPNYDVWQGDGPEPPWVTYFRQLPEFRP